MDLLNDVYRMNPTFWNAVIALLVFGGMARIAFWRDDHGLKVGGMLAVGLALMLAVGLLIWAEENSRSIKEFGPWAACLLAVAVLALGLNFWRKSKHN